ncbi:MAG: HDOD domain-containing protein [Nitrosomonadales bacterium]|nr:HDOD domain-containing protein [Nitrosomonadales bacterium]
MTTHELSFDEIHHTLATIEIPSCPAVVTEVMTEAQKDDPDLAKLSRVISSDVGMAAFTIKLANSAHFLRGAPVANVPMAVSRLGTRNIVCVVVAAALRASMSRDLPTAFLEQFWNRAGTVASAAGLLARRLRGVQADTAYSYALFHDAAIPVMMKRFGDYTKMMIEVKTNGLSLPQTEMERYNCNHAIVGGLLANNWNLPQNIARAIRHHHDEESYDHELKFVSKEELGLMATVHLAERLVADLLGETDIENGSLFDMSVAHFGLTEDDLYVFQEALTDALT